MTASAEQQRAMAMANARMRAAEATPPPAAVQQDPESFMTQAEGFAGNVAQGATFNLSDEIGAGITKAAMETGKYMRRGLKAAGADVTPYEDVPSFEEIRKAGNAPVRRFQENHGVLATGAQIIGGIASGTATGKLLASKFPDIAGPAGTLTKYAKSNPIRTGALSGSLSGEVYGAGGSEGGVGERLVDAIPSAALGGVLGGAGGYAAGKVSDYLGDKADRLAVGVKQGLAETAGQPIPPARDAALGKVIKRLRADYPDEADFQAALDNFVKNPDAGLAEVAGKRTKNLAEGASQYPSGQAEGEQYFANRVGSARDRIRKTFSDYVSTNKDYYGTLDDVVESGRARAKPLYDEAYKANKAVASPEIDKILDTPAGKKALGDARTKMMNDRSLMGMPDKELGEMAREMQAMGEMAATPGGVAKGLNMRSLDYVKRALDDQISTAYRAGEKDNGRIITDLKNTLLSAMDDADITKRPGSNRGAYAEARQMSGDYLRASQAMDNGKNFESLGDPEQIKKYFTGLGDTEKDAFKAGMVRGIKDKMDASVDNANLYQKLFGNQAKRQKIASVLSPAEFEKLSKNMQAEDQLYRFRDQVLGNSRTASRQIAAEEFSDEMGQFAESVARHGASRAVTDKAISFITRSFDGLSDKTAGKVAKILYETDPDKKLAILKSIRGAADLAPQERTTAIKAFFSMDNAVRKSRATALGNVAGAVSGQTSKENDLSNLSDAELQARARKGYHITVAPGRYGTTEQRAGAR